MEVIYDHSEKVAHNTRTFWFRAPHKPDYQAGQFIELYLPHANADNRGQKRWFTLSSSPSEDFLAVTTKYTPAKSSSFKRQLFSLAAGNVANISQPIGDFVLPKDQRVPLVFIAAGVGITPVRSMIVWLADKGERRDVHVIYCLRNRASAAFRDIFESYGAKLDLVLSRQSPSSSGHSNIINSSLVNELIHDASGKLLYISGPEQFVEKLEADIRRSGVSADQLVLDYYHGYTAN